MKCRGGPGTPAERTVGASGTVPSRSGRAWWAVDVDVEQAERRAEDQGDPGVGELVEPGFDPRRDRRDGLERLPPEARLLRARQMVHDGEAAPGEGDIRRGRNGRRRASGAPVPSGVDRRVIQERLLPSGPAQGTTLARADHPP